MVKPEKLVKSLYGDLSTPENVDVVGRKEDLPSSLPEAIYVVVDVMYFSTTSVRILEGGAEELIVYRELKDKAETIATLLGGERDPDYNADDGYDLFNSPSFVEELDLDGHRVGLTSTNGAETVHLIEERTSADSEVIIGSTVNSEAVAQEISSTEKPVYIIACGRTGKQMKEDLIGAYLIVQHIKGDVSDDVHTKVSKAVDEAVKHYYETVPDVRGKDIEDHIKRIDSTSIVPRKIDSDPIKFQ